MKLWYIVTDVGKLIIHSDKKPTVEEVRGIIDDWEFETCSRRKRRQMRVIK